MIVAGRVNPYLKKLPQILTFCFFCKLWGPTDSLANAFLGRVWVIRGNLVRPFNLENPLKLEKEFNRLFLCNYSILQ